MDAIQKPNPSGKLGASSHKIKGPPWAPAPRDLLVRSTCQRCHGQGGNTAAEAGAEADRQEEWFGGHWSGSEVTEADRRETAHL